jgi:FdhE protein
LNIITVEEEKGFRLDTCSACTSYIKTVQADRMESLATDYADLLSLPLDIIAQGKGFRRNAPNPIGMLRLA